MAYTPAWLEPSDALRRVATATGQSNDEVRSDICRAIADRAIKIRAKLWKSRTMTASNMVQEGDDFEIPTDLKPDDLDWDQSRPLQKWFLRRERSRVHGYWYLAWIEVSAADVKTVLCDTEEPNGPVPTNQPRISEERRTRPTFDRAKKALKELYPDGVPDQADLPNAVLCRQVGVKLREAGQPDVSDDTILRAAGRRK